MVLCDQTVLLDDVLNGGPLPPDAFADCQETVFRLGGDEDDEDHHQLRAFGNHNNNFHGFLSDAFEMFKYFAVLAVHLTKAVCAYIVCRLDDYAEKAVRDEEGEELNVEEMRKRMMKRKKRMNNKMTKGGNNGLGDASSAAAADGIEEDDDEEDDEDETAR